MAQQSRSSRSATRPSSRTKVQWTMPLSRQQFILVGAGVAIVILGFVLLSLGMSSGWDNPLSVDVAPVVLVIGYCVVIPFALLYRGKKQDS